jgi:hypothetical protein
MSAMAVGIINNAAGCSDNITDNDLAGSVQIWHAQMIVISIPARFHQSAPLTLPSQPNITPIKPMASCSRCSDDLIDKNLAKSVLI